MPTWFCVDPDPFLRSPFPPVHSCLTRLRCVANHWTLEPGPWTLPPCLGIDPGLNRCGYAVLVRTLCGPVLKEGGVIRTSPSQNLAERVLEIGRELRAIIEEFQPAAMAIEQVFSLGKNPKSAILMAHARGAILFAAADRESRCITTRPKQIKKLLTGSGAADKTQVQRVVARELSLDAVPEPHDVADACAHRAVSSVFDANGRWSIVWSMVSRMASTIDGRRSTTHPSTLSHPPSAMITNITGQLVALHDNDATLAVGAFEYQVLVPDFVRRQLQARLQQTVSLRTIEYIEGNPQKGGRMVPRLVGFLHEAEREFFDLICQVDGVGVKKALAAMVRPVREVATAIEEQDVKLLSALPGIGPAMAERIVAKLRRKMARFALLIEADVPAEAATARSVLNDAYDALVALGHSGPDARAKIEQVCEGNRKFKSVDDLLREVYQQNRGK